VGTIMCGELRFWHELCGFAWFRQGKQLSPERKYQKFTLVAA